MKHKKPDGTIELGCSGCCCPPGEKRKGQHTNSGTSWYRINQEPWQRIEGSTSAMLKLAIASLSVEEFLSIRKHSTE